MIFESQLTRSSGVQSRSQPETRPRLQRKCACGGTPGPSGECEACKRKRLRLQAKLTINQPGDRYEQEADRVAEAVVGGTSARRPSISSLGSGGVQREEPAKPSAGTLTSLGRWVPDFKLTGETKTEEPKKKEEETLQRKNAEHDEVSDAPPIISEVLESPGEPLDHATRVLMEERFGHDFGSVRVRRDGRAAASARAVKALAYTVGRNIVFGDGQFAPGTAQGRHLLAHELTHVVQQECEPVAKQNAVTNESRDASEVQADDIALSISLDQSLGQWHPVQPASLLSLAPETWYRGAAEGVPPVSGSKVEGGHDLGDGYYITDRETAAEDYAAARIREHRLPAGAKRISSAEIDTSNIGRVLDLTKDERWESFLKRPVAGTREAPVTAGQLIKTTRNYNSMFQMFCRENKINIEDYDVIIGPETVRGGKQMCIRNPKMAEKVRSSMKPVKRGGTGGTGGESGGSGGEEGPSRPRRRRSPTKGAAGVEPPAGETETPAPRAPARRRGPGGLHLPEESHPLTVRRAGKDIALGLGAGLVLGILQSEMRQKIEEDLAKLPKPKIDKRGAEEFLEDPKAAAGAKLMDLFNKQLKPFRGELTEFSSGLMEEMNEQLLGLAEKKGKAKGTYQQKLAALKRLEKKLDAYREKLNTIDDNLDGILEKEADSLKTKESADNLLKWLKNGVTWDWLIHEGFDIDEIERMESNLAAISNSITKLFDETRKTKELVKKLKQQEEAMSQSLQETENQEFRGLFELYVQERRQKEAEMLRGRERPDSPLPEPEPSPYLNPDERGSYFGLRTEESELLIKLKKLEESVSPNDLETLKQMHEWQGLKRQLDDVRKEKGKYEAIPA